MPSDTAVLPAWEGETRTNRTWPPKAASQILKISSDRLALKYHAVWPPLSLGAKPRVIPCSLAKCASLNCQFQTSFEYSI